MNIRISEQEAKFVYCSVLNNSEYFYSIETPTEKEYQLSGKGKRSASTDLSIYKYTKDGFEKLVNVEFKAHNARFGEIEKDIRKLVQEGYMGNWFHLLVNVDSKTLRALFGKIKRALIENRGEKISILLCFCVLNKKWACMKHFNWDSEKSNQDYDAFVGKFFELDYEVGKKIKVVDGNGWLIYTAHNLIGDTTPPL